LKKRKREVLKSKKFLIKNRQKERQENFSNLFVELICHALKKSKVDQILFWVFPVMVDHDAEGGC